MSLVADWIRKVRQGVSIAVGCISVTLAASSVATANVVYTYTSPQLVKAFSAGTLANHYDAVGPLVISLTFASPLPPNLFVLPPLNNYEMFASVEPLAFTINNGIDPEISNESTNFSARMLFLTTDPDGLIKGWSIYVQQLFADSTDPGRQHFLRAQAHGDSSNVAFADFLLQGPTNIGQANARGIGVWTVVQDPSNIPEPGTLALLTLGLAGLGYSRRKVSAEGELAMPSNKKNSK